MMGGKMWDQVEDLNGSLVSGADAAAHVAYGLSDVLIVQPVVDAQNAEFVAAASVAWNDAGKKNCYGRVTEISKVNAQEANASQLSTAVTGDKALGAVFTGSFLLRKMLPNMYQIAAEGTAPVVLHVAALRSNTEGDVAVVENDLSDISLVRETGFGLLSSASVKEVHDMAVIAHVVAHRTGVPFINFFDGTRVSNELSRVSLLDYSEMNELISEADRGEFRQNNLIDVIDGVMKSTVHILGGAQYAPFEYEGATDAEMVVIAIGCAAQNILEAVRAQMGDKTRASKCKIGVLRVRVVRPWSTQHMLESLPQTTRRVCVIDQNKSGDYDTPLFKDVAAAFHSDSSWVAPILISGNIVNSSVIGFTPAVSKAILDNLSDKEPVLRFTLNDLYIPDTLSNSVVHSSILVKQAVSWTMGGINHKSKHAISVILGPLLSLCVQQHDSYSIGTNVHKSDIRFAPMEIVSEYPILGADIIACDDPAILLLPQCDILAQAKKTGGTKLVINSSWTTAAQLEHELPDNIKGKLAAFGVEVFVVDANALSTSKTESNWVMQAAILSLSGSTPVDYSQSYQHLAKIVNTLGLTPVLADQLSPQTIGKHVVRVELPVTSWKGKYTVDEVDAYGRYLPYDMLPTGVLIPQQEYPYLSERSVVSVTAYHELLNQLFGERLAVADTTKTGDNVSIVLSDSVESSYGGYVVKSQARKRLVDFVEKLLSNSSNITSYASKELIALLGIWHGVHNNAVRCGKIIPRLADLLASEKHKSEGLEYVYKNRTLLAKTSKWIVGGENWAYDMSGSGIHHILSSGEDINVIIFDTSNHTDSSTEEAIDETADLNTTVASLISRPANETPKPRSSDKRKKDIGLYSMNYGSAYVASISLLASQSQSMRALSEADSFNGPSIIIAHAPRTLGFEEEPSTIATAAVESGEWPLYRWNPLLQDEEFILDSAKLKAEIQEFLKREQQLSILAKAKPTIPEGLGESLDTVRTGKHEELKKQAQLRRLNEQFDQLVEGVSSSGNPNLELLVLYGSDGGNASAVAEKLAKKAEASGCGEVRCMEANMYNVDELSEEKHLLLVLATAGQGEACANAKQFSEKLLEHNSRVTGLKYAVFGLGDSHYWGESSADSAKYFCMNAKQIDEKLSELGGARLVGVGLGDDQHDDGYNGALVEWEPAMWSALEVKINEDANLGGPPPIIDDDIKEGSRFLRGMIDEGLRDLSTGKLLPEDTKLTKFHGIYQQDLRTVREELDAKGLERAYSFMIRIGIPGGVATSEQYIAMDDICTKYANGALKVTTRQAYQLHGVVKHNLKTTMKAINRACLDTLAACGDVNRNIIANPHIRKSEAHAEVNKLAHLINTHLKPKTSAYAEIWLDKKPVGGSINEEPIYGVTYLPRKFKIAIAVPPLNDVDVFSHCLGFIAIIEHGVLKGWNICIGGGMGTTHGDKATYPRLSDILGFCTTEQAVVVAEKVVLIQRDYGERKNRKHARLKYTVEDLGMTFFRSKVEEMAGFKLGEGRPFKFNSNADPYGWALGRDGLWDYTMFVENGYIKDSETYKIKTGLREIAEFHTGGEISLTATQNVIIGAVTPERKPQIEALLRKYNIDNARYSAMRLHSMACVAMPTCALAMAESQTYLPSLIDKFEVILDEAGLRHDAITIRMTGCANGCARPYMAEIGFVGKAPGQYNLMLGGGFAGNRVSKIYREGVNESQILEIMKPMLHNYATKRLDGERFGDFCIRTGIIEPTLKGRCFWSHGPENELDTPSGTNQIYW
mmetsp:Transcript_1383/g.1833  ORF Transcript_1383/g.1833 Transcript_1383/m.1833 type:complete len:1763 (-) Transcript_1383:39-5327(-)